MLNDSVLNVLLADNPWLEGEDAVPWIKRHLPENYVERTIKITPGQRVALVTGPRQSGKSTLIWKTLSTLSRPCLYVNCEEPAIRDWATSPALFIEGMDQIVSPETVVFFEEVQQLSEAGLFLKGLVDRKSRHPFLATGSSSYDLESRTRESLAGRAQRHLLPPFSLAELSTSLAGPPALRRKQLEAITRELIIHGGYPSVFLGEKKEALLTGLVESFIIRDASDRFRIRHTDAFRKLLKLMASQIGNLCNYSEWASLTGISADTVKDYASILEDAHVIKIIPPFVGGRRAEITGAPKVYFVDTGIRNRLFGGFPSLDTRPDKGALVENYVFSEMFKNTHPLVDSLRFWRSKSGAEVDFVIEREGKLIAIEVKAGQARGRISRSAHSFIDAYEPEEFWVVSDQPHPGFRKNTTSVMFTTPFSLGEIFARS